MGLLVLKKVGVYDTGRVLSHATASEAMTHVPFVIVTGTTEVIRSIPRIRVNEAYADAIVEAGLVPLILPPIDAAAAVAALNDVAGLVLTGGEDVDPALFGESPRPETGAPHHRRDAYEIALALAALDLRLPTLAICRGAQVVNVALGGSLIQDIPTQRPGSAVHDPAGKRAERVHRVDIEPDSRLARHVGATSITTNSSHHQSVDRVASGLRVTARSEDGIIEALESTDPNWWMIAVQWHPEELTATPEAWDRRLFAAFGDAVRAGGRD
jgi:putative glutamine amidotransferase